VGSGEGLAVGEAVQIAVAASSTGGAVNGIDWQAARRKNKEARIKRRMDRL
jgi:hypothetical protein